MSHFSSLGKIPVLGSISTNNGRFKVFEGSTEWQIPKIYLAKKIWKEIMFHLEQVHF